MIYTKGYERLIEALRTGRDTLGKSDLSLAAERMVDVLESGGVVLHPTDTIYGLAADATNPTAIAKLKLIKGRDKKPLLLFVSNIEMLKQYAHVSGYTERLLIDFQGRPLSVILETNDDRLAHDCKLENSVGCRIPSDLFTKKVITVFDKPIATTSANVSNCSYVGDLERLFELFYDKVDMFIVGETGAAGLPSTVIDCRNEPYVIVRPGAVSAEELKEYL